jgi:exosortase/archaeosortase family protein
MKLQITTKGKKLVLWLIICIITSVIFFHDFWANIGTLLSFSYLQQYGVYPWFVLFLCFVWLWQKRAEISVKMSTEKIYASPPFIILGLALFGLALLLPSASKFIVFQLLLACIGIFTILFGAAVYIPILLLGVYGFTLVFPIVITEFAEVQYSVATVWVVASILKGIGYQILSQGQVIRFSGLSGDISIFIDSECSGSASMAVFIAIFALMMIDIKLPAKKAIPIFIFGVIGTTLQNILRLIILIISGYYYGKDALWTAHSYAGYIIFPIWFALFAFVYLRQVEC